MPARSVNGWISTPSRRSRRSTMRRLGRGEHVAPVAVPAHEVVDVRAAGAHPLHDLQRGDAAADHDRRLRLAAAADDVPGVVHVVKLDNAVQVGAGDARRDRRGAGGEEQAVVAEPPAARQHHLVRARLDGLGALPDPRDPQRAQLGRAEGEQPPLGQLVGEVVGQAGAGVEAVRVGADDDDLGVRVGAADGLRGRDGRRPSADEHVAAGRRDAAALPARASPSPAARRLRRLRTAGHPSGDRRVHRLEVQQPARAALDALAAGQAAAVADRLVAPGVAAHVEPHRTVERAHAALHAPARLGHDPRARQRPVLLSVGGEEPHVLMVAPVRAVCRAGSVMRPDLSPGCTPARCGPRRGSTSG